MGARCSGLSEPKPLGIPVGLMVDMGCQGGKEPGQVKHRGCITAEHTDAIPALPRGWASPPTPPVLLETPVKSQGWDCWPCQNTRLSPHRVLGCRRWEPRHPSPAACTLPLPSDNELYGSQMRFPIFAVPSASLIDGADMR